MVYNEQNPLPVGYEQEAWTQYHLDEQLSFWADQAKEEGTPMTHHGVYVHTNESAYAQPVGVYTWEEALKRKDELLLHYPSVSIDGTRYWASKEERDALHYQQIHDSASEYNCWNCHDQGCYQCMNEQDLYS